MQGEVARMEERESVLLQRLHDAQADNEQVRASKALLRRYEGSVKAL